MKTFIVLIAMLASAHSFSQSEPVLVDVPSDDQIAQSLDFTGKPGVIVTATMVKTDGDYGSLMITHKKPNDVRYYVGAMNDTLFQLNESLAGYTTLDKNAAGSLLINSANDSVGRDRWSRTLTVAYRNNKYLIVGYTYSSIDTYTMKSEECDYNLQTKKGTRNKKAVRIATGSIDLNKWVDAEKFFTCKGW
ncbi:MAG: hypothetical protein ACJ76H_04535 [Bacteriovoracaceae bacterium]